MTTGLLDLPMLEAETGIVGEEKDRALQAEDTQQHQTPLRGAPFPLHCGKRIKQYSCYAHLIPLQVWPIVSCTCVKLGPFLSEIDSEKPPYAKIVVVRTATGAFPSPKPLYRLRSIVLSAKNRGILGYTVSKAVF